MEEAKRIPEPERVMEQGDTKCFVVMASTADWIQRRDARVRVLMEETLEECLMAPIEYVQWVLMEVWSEVYAASEHWNKVLHASPRTGIGIPLALMNSCFSGQIASS